MSNPPGLPNSSQDVNRQSGQREADEIQKQEFFRLSVSGSPVGHPDTNSTTSSSSLNPTKSNNVKRHSNGSSNRAAKVKKPYADQLGADGKLLPGERAWQLVKKLCLFCSLPDHKGKDCNKRRVALEARSAHTSSSKADALLDLLRPRK